MNMQLCRIPRWNARYHEITCTHQICDLCIGPREIKRCCADSVEVNYENIHRNNLHPRITPSHLFALQAENRTALQSPRDHHPPSPFSYHPHTHINRRTRPATSRSKRTPHHAPNPPPLHRTLLLKAHYFHFQE